MHFVIPPIAFVAAAVSPVFLPIPLCAAISELACVASAVRKYQDSSAMHFLALPLPVVVASIFKALLSHWKILELNHPFACCLLALAQSLPLAWRKRSLLLSLPPNQRWQIPAFD